MQTPTAPAAAARYYETRQQVAIATGHLVDGIRSQLARERYIAPGEAHNARTELLAQLRAAAERGVALTAPPGSDATIRGWLEAATIAADNARNPTLGAARLAAFRTRFPTHPALSALANEPGVGSPGSAGDTRKSTARRVAAAAHGTHVGARRADPRRLHDRLLPGARERAPAPARVRHRVRRRRRHRGERHRRGRGVHRRTAHARRSRRGRRAPVYPAAGARAQFPAARPAGARAFLPVRAVARG